MSSPKRAAAKARPKSRPSERLAARAPKAAKPASAGASLSTDAINLAAAVKRELAGGNTGVLSQAAVQALMSAACRTYSAHVDAGSQYLPAGERDVTPTDIMVTASGLLKSGNLAVFELGLWQSWTGR
jgi:hypothetical protein